MRPPGPEYLYKYCTIGHTVFPSAAELLLTQGKLYFPSPADFNDPFDCKFQMTFCASRTKRLRYARELARAKAPPGTPKYVSKQIAKHGLGAGSYRSAAQRFVDHISHRVGILSMSAKRDNILLWSHYANKHAGLCLEFRRSGELQYALPITYSEDPPRVEFFEIEGLINLYDEAGRAARWRFIEVIYLTKSMDWGYESEWRLIDPTRRGLRLFSPSLLSGIIFGCRTTAEDKQKVRDWIARSETSPKLYQASEAAESFRLEIAEVLR